jgi:cell division protein FtsN
MAAADSLVAEPGPSASKAELSSKEALSSTTPPPRTEPTLSVPKPWTASEPEAEERGEKTKEKLASSNEESMEREPLAEESGDPDPPIVLTREIVRETRPEDVPLVDEASGSEEAARFAIQCGSFRERDRAQELASRMGSSVMEKVQIVPLEMSSGTWFRVLLGDFESEAEARAKIAQVHAHDRLLILQVIRLSRPAGAPPSAG